MIGGNRYFRPDDIITINNYHFATCAWMWLRNTFLVYYWNSSSFFLFSGFKSFVATSFEATVDSKLQPTTTFLLRVSIVTYKLLIHVFDKSAVHKLKFALCLSGRSGSGVQLCHGAAHLPRHPQHGPLPTRRQAVRHFLLLLQVCAHAYRHLHRCSFMFDDG